MQLKTQIWVVKVLAEHLNQFIQVCTENKRIIKLISTSPDPKWAIVTFGAKYYWTQLVKYASEVNVTIAQLEDLPPVILETQNNGTMYLAKENDASVETGLALITKQEDDNRKRLELIAKKIAKVGLCTEGENLAHILKTLNITTEKLDLNRNIRLIEQKIKIAEIEKKIRKLKAELEEEKIIMEKIKEE